VRGYFSRAVFDRRAQKEKNAVVAISGTFRLACLTGSGFNARVVLAIPRMSSG